MFEFLRKKELVAPVDGKLIPIEEVDDPVFAEKMMGDGFAIISEGKDIYACNDGVVTMLYPSKHAIGITLQDEMELLIHIGIDTVMENGNGFEAFVQVGDKVRRGDLLVKMDREYLLGKGYDLTVITIFTNANTYREFTAEYEKKVKGGKDVAVRYKK